MIKMDINKLIIRTIVFFAGDAKRVQHFIKVHSFAKLIAEIEGLKETELNTLEAAAVVHDVGIKPAEAKFGRCDGKLQEQEGPVVARPLLIECGATDEQIERICFLISHHHTYCNINSLDYQILVEADFLVNIYEDGIPSDEISTIRERIFRTKTGKSLIDKCYQTFFI